jgi:YD repeat-containing protein
MITNQPTTQTNFLGANVNFNVGVYGLPTLFFQWNFNNVPIPGATNKQLVLSNIALTNTGNYSVTISNAVMTIVSSNAFLMVLDTSIPLDDGIPNWWKEEYGLSTNDPTLATNYPPADNQLTYLEKYLYGLNPLTNDTDGDGLTDYDEIFIYHTNPLLPSTAGDGIPDGWKVQYGLNPLISIANSEAGFDGVTYLQIYQYDLTHTNQLNPNNPFSVGQALSNYEIINSGQHTNKFYYDHEDRLQGMESSRGISIGYQYDGNGNLLRQSVLSRAAETNGVPVLWLWLNGLTNQPGIAYANSSGNGWNNYQEWLAGLSPNSNSVPSLLNNPGTNIATLAVPFTPTNWVMAAGALNGVAGDEIVVGADGIKPQRMSFIAGWCRSW